MQTLNIKLEQRSEVVAMSIYEYNEEYIRRELHEDGYAEGYSEGKRKVAAEVLPRR